jgi:hypothetical protein
MTMTRRSLVAVACVLALAACSHGPKPDKQTHYAPPPASSPLSKINTGMTEAEVLQLVGQPQSQHAGISGKQFIPFYYGPDTERVVYFYKGEGRVVFGGGRQAMTVQHVEYDPSEDGQPGHQH